MQITPKPTYAVMTRITGAVTDTHHHEQLEDPFVNTTTTVVISFRDAVRALLKRRRIELTVVHHVTGNRDAMLHVMNVRPVSVERREATPVGSEVV